jgi:hypothetical protein
MDTWPEFFKRFKSPVVFFGTIVLLLNTLRIVLGWTIDQVVWEAIIDLIIYVGGGSFMGTNNPTTPDEF